jgi:hypothetical protein
MHHSSNRFSSLIILWLVSACFALFFCQQARPQDAFDLASNLMKQWSAAQQKKQQQPNDANLNELSQVTTSISQEVPGLLRRGTLEFLNSQRAVSPIELKARIASVLANAPSAQYEPEVSVYRVGAGQNGSYLVAYNVIYCASCSRSWIGLIEKRNGRYEVVSEETGSFDGKSLHVAPLARSQDGKDRFLVYGTNWGDAHNRLTAVAYAIDDPELEKFWSRTDLVQGSVRATSRQISLTFLTALSPPWAEKTEVYELEQRQEIKLQSSSERPNP